MRLTLLHKVPQPAAFSIPEGLTPTEFTVLSLLPNATSNKALARKLRVSEAAIKYHLRNLYRKLDVGKRRDAIRVARARGWIPETPSIEDGQIGT